MAIELRLFTIGSVISLILASAATTSIVHGQTIFPKAQNATNTSASPSHAPPKLVPTKPSTPRTNVPSSLSLTKQPKPHLVNIASPSMGERVLVGKDLLISGTSAGNINATSINCQVSVIVNGVRPYQRTTAAGSGGPGDYSKWNFTLVPQHATD